MGTGSRRMIKRGWKGVEPNNPTNVEACWNVASRVKYAVRGEYG